MEEIYIVLAVLFITVVGLIWMNKRKYSEVNVATSLLEVEQNEDDQMMHLVQDENSAYVMPVDIKNIEALEPVELGSDWTNSLRGIIKSAGVSAAVQMINRKQAFELVFSPETEAAIKKGVYEISKSKDEGLYRAFVKNGRVIKEHANLKKINPLQMRMLLLSVATTVVAQEHLKEIKKSLDKIQITLDNLVAMKLNDYHGQVKSSFNYLDRVHIFIKEESIDHKVVQQLEYNYKVDIDSLYALLKDIEIPIKTLKEIKKRTFVFQEADKLNALKNVVTEFQEYEELIYMFLLNTQGAIHAMRMLGDPENAIVQATNHLNKMSQEFEMKRSDFHLSLENYEKEFKVRFALEKRERHQIQLISNERIQANQLSMSRSIDVNFKPEVEQQKIFIVADGDDIKVMALSNG
ncbi:MULTISPECIES: hypothetical protein [unclassified Exiguobacterium]|uniref:hypothetical protein n=1 Tax=unclassified Exiguobacterium TaxID=2644629 RepID=UPI001BE87038|nr:MULTISPECIES: hypothetical protein [unclassified Exiguobacterium]